MVTQKKVLACSVKFGNLICYKAFVKNDNSRKFEMVKKNTCPLSVHKVFRVTIWYQHHSWWNSCECLSWLDAMIWLLENKDRDSLSRLNRLLYNTALILSRRKIRLYKKFIVNILLILERKKGKKNSIGKSCSWIKYFTFD